MKNNNGSGKILNNFNDWLEQGLSNRGWSIRELSRRCGVSQSHISNVKNGERSVTYDIVATIADAFNERREAAFRRVGLLPNHKTSIEELQEIMDYLSEKEQVEILKYAEWKREDP